MPEPTPLTVDGQPVGWTVTDPDGNVVASGPIDLDLARLLGFTATTPEGA